MRNDSWNLVKISLQHLVKSCYIFWSLIESINHLNQSIYIFQHGCDLGSYYYGSCLLVRCDNKMNALWLLVISRVVPLSEFNNLYLPTFNLITIGFWVLSTDSIQLVSFIHPNWLSSYQIGFVPLICAAFWINKKLMFFWRSRLIFWLFNSFLIAIIISNPMILIFNEK